MCRTIRVNTHQGPVNTRQDQSQDYEPKPSQCWKCLRTQTNCNKILSGRCLWSFIKNVSNFQFGFFAGDFRQPRSCGIVPQPVNALCNACRSKSCTKEALNLSTDDHFCTRWAIDEHMDSACTETISQNGPQFNTNQIRMKSDNFESIEPQWQRQTVFQIDHNPPVEKNDLLRDSLEQRDTSTKRSSPRVLVKILVSWTSVGTTIHSPVTIAPLHLVPQLIRMWNKRNNPWKLPDK